MMRQDVGEEIRVSGNPQWRNTFTSLPSTLLVPVLPLWRLLLLPPASVQSHCAGFNQAAMLNSHIYMVFMHAATCTHVAHSEGSRYTTT